MPEGPEVRRMAMNLAERIEGKVLEKAEITGGKWLKKPQPNISDFQDSLPSKITKIDVKGKSIQVYLENGWTIWNTLGMGGGWRDLHGKHSHFKLQTKEGKIVWFEDIRRFGNIFFINEKKDLQRRLDAIGPDLLGEKVSLENFSEIIKSNGKKAICKVLMDQKYVSGIGNYIKAEVLYRARISPWRLCSSLSEGEIKSLHEFSIKIIKKSFEQGGATLATYTDMDGNRGEFVFSFHVYRKDKCPLGYNVKREITPDGRTTHWVPEVQL